MKNAINKDKYFEEQDAILLRNFLDKISSELKIKPNWVE